MLSCYFINIMYVSLLASCNTEQPITLPSYSLRERTSGAIYAGVPTVDLGLECSRDDCSKKSLKIQ